MVCFAVVMLYLSIAGFEYLAEKFEWDIAIANWGEVVGESYQAPTLETPVLETPDMEPPTLQDRIDSSCGTDFLGRSTLRKALYGAKMSITVAICASLISLGIGVPLGAIAGYYRGFVDEIIIWVYSTIGTVPWILMAMAFAVVLKGKTVLGTEITGITTIYLAIGLTSWVGICRLIRGEIIKRKESEYVLAAKATGCSNARIIFRHLLPNVSHIIIINFSLRFVGFIHAEVILSFLGLGETDRPTWGAMIDAAKLEIQRGFWWELAAATVAIFFLSLALNIFGDALRDCLDPKLRTE